MERLMSKGFGIAALVCAILAIFIPLGIFLSAVAIVLACIAALAGDRIFATATAIIAVVNTLFLSPSTWIMLGGGDPAAKSFMTGLILVGGALPFVAMALNAAGKISLKSRSLSG
jgi:hypothetical protein